MIKKAKIALLVVPALVAGIASCNRAADAQTGGTDTFFWQKRRQIPVKAYAKAKPAIDPNAPVPLYYSIPYLGNVDGHPLELELTFSTDTDTVFGNYIEKYTRWGDTDYYLSGKVSDGLYNIKFTDYEDVTGELKLAGNGKGYALGGTFKCNNKPRSKEFTATPTVDIDQNRQLLYSYRLVTAEPTRESGLNTAGLSYRYDMLQQVVISDGEKHVQTLDFENHIIVGNKILALRDYNFDGYLDLAVTILYPTAPHGGSGFVCFLYNPETGEFKKNESLGYDNLTVYYSREEIFYHEGDQTGYIVDTYKWYNDTLLQVARAYEREDDHYKKHYEEYTVQNGQSILTKEYTE